MISFCTVLCMSCFVDHSKTYHYISMLILVLVNVVSWSAFFVGRVLLLFNLVFIVGYVIRVIIDCAVCLYRCAIIFQWYVVGMMAECNIGIFNRIGSGYVVV